MKLKRRLLILAVLTAIFLIAAPITIYFALGYRYDFGSHRLIKTGTLMVRSEPRGAHVLIDGKDTGLKTPATIRFISPGEFDVAIIKDGYTPWNKRLSVMAEQVTFAHPNNGKITLFLHSPELQMLATSTLGLLSVKETIYALRATTTLSLWDVEKNKTFFTETRLEKAALPKVAVSKDGLWLFADVGEGQAANIQSGKTVSLDGLKLQIKKIQSLGLNTLAVLDSRGQLFEYDIGTRKLLLRSANTQAFDVHNGVLYYVANKSLLAYTRNNADSRLIAATLPKTEELAITEGTAGRLFMLADTSLYDTGGGKLTLLGKNIKSSSWDTEAGLLFFYGNNEIWTFDPHTGSEPRLITRSGDPISVAFLNFESDTVFFLQAGRIKTIELNAEISRNTNELLSAGQPITNFWVDLLAEHIYYLLPGGELFKAKIR